MLHLQEIRPSYVYLKISWYFSSSTKISLALVDKLHSCFPCKTYCISSLLQVGNWKTTLFQSRRLWNGGLCVSHTECVNYFFLMPQPEVLELYKWLRFHNTTGKILSLDPCCRHLLHFLHTWYFHFHQWEFHMLNKEEIFAFWITALFGHFLILSRAKLLLTLILLASCPLDESPRFEELVNGILTARVSNNCRAIFLAFPNTKLSSEVRHCSSFLED